MKIILDNIVFAIQKAGGISVVWVEHLKRLLNSKADIECIEASVVNNIHTSCLKEIGYRKRYFNPKFLYFYRYLDVRLRNVKKTFIFHSSYFRVSSNPYAVNITTVHDFTYEKFSSGIRKFIHCFQKHRAIRKSDYIICISENTKQDLLKYLPDVCENKIRVIHNGVGDAYYPIKSPWKSDIIPYKRNEYVLFVGARVGYKNFSFMVDALSGSGYSLVIVGSPLSNDEKEFLEAKLGHNYYAVGRISDEQLNVLYNGAYALLYPSSYEGFGIPVLESQKAGCPVIAYAASSIPEIIGNDTLLMNSLSKEELLKKLEILSNKNTRLELIQDGFENVSKFSWDITYEKTYQLYKQAIEEKFQKL